MNATLIANGINMNFTDIDMLRGVMKTLRSSGRAMELGAYAAERKDGEVDGAGIAGQF